MSIALLSLKVTTIFLILLSPTDSSTTLFCKRVWWFREQVHCELIVEVKGQVIIGGIHFKGAEILDDKPEIELNEVVVSYGKKSEHFPSGLGIFFTNLKILEISVIGLKFLHRNCFEKLTNLTDLKVFHTEISFLPQDVFIDLENLEILNLANNHIANLPENLLWYNRQLKSIDLSQNRIGIVPSNFFSFSKKIESIEFQDNNIEGVRFNFLYLKNLKRINFNGNSKFCDFCYGFEKSTVKTLSDFQWKVEKYCNLRGRT